MSTRRAMASVLRCALALCAASAAGAAEFKPLGVLPDPNFSGSSALAVSADGRTIAGDSAQSTELTNGVNKAVLWFDDVGPKMMNPAPGSNSFTALSADGTAAIGNSSMVYGSPPASFAIYWSRSTGVTVPGFPAQYMSSVANAISADGGTMVGSLVNADPFGTPTGRQAARGSRNEGMFFGGLGYLPGGSDTSSSANAVSADGSVIVGDSTSANSDQEAFRWTAATGMVGLGFLPGGTSSTAGLVSSDGLVVVGTVRYSSDPWRASIFRWTEATGMTDLGTLPGGVFTYPVAMTPDGRFVTGFSDAVSFRWSEATGMVALPLVPGAQRAFAMAISDDGSKILGRCFFADGPMDYFLWTEADGARTLGDILAASGVDVTAWQPLTAQALSGNGDAIVGQGNDPRGFPEAWVIRFQGDHAPTAVIGSYSPQYPIKGQPLSFWGTGSVDLDGDQIVSYRWDFGDGTTATDAVVDHTYPRAGNYTVTLVVSDGKLDSAPASVDLAVSDQQPIANAGGPYSGAKNAPIAFDGTRSSDLDGDPLTYAWDFGDGTTGTGPRPSHAYARSGRYMVTLIVNDGSIDSPPSHAWPTVTNTAPVAALTGPASGFRGTALAFDGSRSSDANGDALTYRWDFGDGSTATTSAAETTHSYAAIGTYHVSLVVEDGEASSAPATLAIAVQDRQPVADAGPDRTVVQRTAVALDGRGSFDPDGSIVGVRWAQVAGPAVTVSGGTTLTPSFVAPRVSANTTLTFEVTVTDNDGMSASDQVDVVVTRK